VLDCFGPKDNSFPKFSDLEKLFLDGLKQAEVFPKLFQELLIFQKFKSFQSLSGASNLQSVPTMKSYFGKD
jgi:hypothetical protein